MVTTTFHATMDTYIDEASPTSSYPTYTNQKIGDTGSSEQWAYWLFDLSSIPSLSTITSASLKVWAYSNYQDTLYSVSNCASTLTSSVTWNTKREARGGDDTTYVPPISSITARELDATTGVQYMFANPIGEYGLVMKATSTNDYMVLASTEASSSYTAELTIIYTPIWDELYVDRSTGNDTDNGSTWALAFRTIDKGANEIIEGGTLHIAYGVYDNEPVGGDVSPVNLTSEITYQIEAPTGTPTTGKVQIGQDYPTLYTFDYSPWDRWVGFWYLGTRYCIGYQASTCDLVTSDKLFYTDPNAVDKIVDILIDDDTERTIYAGTGLILEEGWVFNVGEINSSEQMTWSLTDGGTPIDSGVQSSFPWTYIYTDTVAGISDVPTIAIEFDDILYGTETSFVKEYGVWQIDDIYTSI